MEESKECGREPAAQVEIVSCDQEAWITDRIHKAIELASEVKSRKGVSANEFMVSGAIDGIVNGCAVEIIRMLGKEPHYINLVKPKALWSQDITGPDNPRALITGAGRNGQT